MKNNKQIIENLKNKIAESCDGDKNYPARNLYVETIELMNEMIEYDETFNPTKGDK